MPKTFFPTVEEALALHQMLIERFGGTAGIRDRGLISSAIHRPQSGYYNSLFEQAASLFESFALNHGFVDGNKRMGFAMCDVFLRLNGYQLNVSLREGVRFVIEDIIEKKVEISEIALWLQKNSGKIR